METYKELVTEKLEKNLENFKTKLSTIRATGAHPALISHLIISYYDVKTPITQLANIKAPDATQLIITPFDKTIIKEIIKVIQAENMGFNPVNEGNSIRIIVPALTGENRLIFVKEAKEIAEEAKISLRNIRHDIIKKIDRESDLSENKIEQDKLEVQKIFDQFNKEIEAILKDKQNQLENI